MLTLFVFNENNNRKLIKKNHLLDNVNYKKLTLLILSKFFIQTLLKKKIMVSEN